jgi:Dolichyl-phosphate-mannose-protein mannosyltransferase
VLNLIFKCKPRLAYPSLILLILIILIFIFWFPLFGSNLPYIYNEDEGHHHNRVVEMVKEGRYNPNYFLKPSLHFYLRMPVVAFGFLNEVRSGRARKLDDLKTRDRFGLAGYSFTSSHPSILKLNRIFSGLAGILVIIVLYKVLIALNISACIALFSAFLYGFLPIIVDNATIVSVDIISSLFIVFSLAVAVNVLNSQQSSNRTSLQLILSGLLAGFAISSKYNALPIAVVPLLAAFKLIRFNYLLVGVAASIFLGFCLGTPYSLLNPSGFLDGIAAEIWHYGIAGHIGNEGKPGIEQFLYYQSWLFSSGLTYLPFILAALGALLTVLTRKNFIIVLAFPTAYLVLMSAQKANFTRNMVLVTPSYIILIGIALNYLRKSFLNKKFYFLFPILLALIIAQPFIVSWQQISIRISYPETRQAVTKWIGANKINSEIAWNGDLELSVSDPNILGTTAIEDTGRFRLYLQGYDWLIDFWHKNYLHPNLTWLGEEQKDYRIIKNPSVVALSLSPSMTTVLSHLNEIKKTELQCQPKNSEEPHCWLNERIFELSRDKKYTLKVMSPWVGQSLEVIVGKSKIFNRELLVNTWEEIAFSTKADSLDAVLLKISKIRSPKDLGINDDPRRLGIAFLNS